MAEREAQLEQRIERIVRDVLASVNDSGRAASATAAAPTKPTNAASHEEDDRRARLVLDKRLITLDVLEGRLDRVTEACFPEGAIVTPAARDALRERGIRLVRHAKEHNNTTETALGVVVGVAACGAEPVAAARLPQMLDRPLEHLAQTGLLSVVEEMVVQVALGGSKGLLFTDEPAIALCVANRRPGVRAVTGRDVNEVQRASASVGANLLIIQPTGLSTWQQLHMARSFVECRVTQCPAAYSAALC